MQDILDVAEEKMQKTVAHLDHELASVRAGRANPAVLDSIQVDYYGVPTPLQQIAAISVTEARILVIQPWDISSLKAIEKAILASDIGITPNNDGKVIRLVFPQLTEERRKELCKDVKKMGEDAKVSVRHIRHDFLEKQRAQKKAGELTEDDVKDGEKDIQKLTDKYVGEIDQLVADKNKEVMSI